MDDYLRRFARQDMRRKVAVTYALAAPDQSERIRGYYSVSNIGVDLADVPEEIARRLPRYPVVPALLVGRLAVAAEEQGKRLGARLLTDAVERANWLGQHTGCALLVVDAFNERARAFYLHFGFRSLLDEPNRLVLALATAKAP